MKQRKAFTPREAAVVLGCGLKRIYDLVWSQKIPATKMNDRWVIPASAVESRLKERDAQREVAA